MKVRQWCWDNGFDDSFGAVWSFDDRTFQYRKWASRWFTARRYYHWLRRLARQVFCWHPRWVHNSSGQHEFTNIEAQRHLSWSSWYKRERVFAIRIWWVCARCGKRDCRYIVDYERNRATTQCFSQQPRAAGERTVKVNE